MNFEEIELKNQGGGLSVYLNGKCLGYGFNKNQADLFYRGIALGIEGMGGKYKILNDSYLLTTENND